MMKGVPTNSLPAGRSLHGKVYLQVSPKEIHFKAGQTFQGKVIHQRANGSILVTTGGKTFEARTSIQLAEGKSYSFLVKTGPPRIELKVMRSEDVNFSSAGNRWISGQKDRVLFGGLLRELASFQSSRNLKQLLPLLLYQGPPQEDAVWLPRNLLSSGIFWENKVFRRLFLDQHNEPVATLAENDLKGLLLSLKKETEGSGSPIRDIQTQVGRIDRLLSLLENHQALNLDALRDGGGWYWFIPGGDQRGLLHGELFGRKEEKSDLHHLHMDLCFSQLGEIHVDCVLLKENVALSLQVTNYSIGRLLEENIALLKKGIEEKGLTVARVACETVTEGNVIHPFAEEKRTNGLMDLVV